jgi:uncharacterized membrane protein YkoI
MNKSLIALGLTGLLVASGGCTHMGKDDDDGATETTITMAEVPEAVKAAFQKAHPNVTPTEIEKETHRDGRTEYAFEFKQDGREQEVEFDANGAPVTEDEGADKDD